MDNLMELLTRSSLTLSEAPWVQQAQNIMMTWVNFKAWLNRYKLIILIQIEKCELESESTVTRCIWFG